MNNSREINPWDNFIPLPINRFISPWLMNYRPGQKLKIKVLYGEKSSSKQRTLCFKIHTWHTHTNTNHICTQNTYIHITYTLQHATSNTFQVHYTFFLFFFSWNRFSIQYILIIVWLLDPLHLPSLPNPYPFCLSLVNMHLKNNNEVKWNKSKPEWEKTNIYTEKKDPRKK